MGVAKLHLDQVRERLSLIEQWRGQMSQDTSPLFTGNLGAAGVFDAGISIADAAGVSKKKLNAEHLFSYTVLAQANCAVEIGTNVGISSSYIGTAMDAAGGDWQLHTLESSRYRIELAKKLHGKLNLKGIRYHQGLFYDILPVVLRNIERPIDLAFIDGQHQYQPTLDFFDMIYEKSAKSALFIFDDVEWSGGMKNAWQNVQDNTARVVMATTINGVGFALTTR